MERSRGRSRWCCHRPEAAPSSPARRSTSEGHADPTRRSLRLTRATHGAPSIACTSAGRTRTTSGASPPASSRSPPRPSSPRSAGRPPPMTDTTPTTAPGTLPGRAGATGRPSTVAEGSRDLLWAAGSGRPRPFLAGEPQRTPGLEVKPSNISLTPRSRPDLTRPPVTAPPAPRQRRRSRDDPTTNPGTDPPPYQPRHAAWRCGCPDGTSTMTIASPSGSRATISMRPQGLRFGSSSITTSAAASRRHSWWTSRT